MRRVTIAVPFYREAGTEIKLNAGASRPKP